jgi:hypothetical protein
VQAGAEGLLRRHRRRKGVFSLIRFLFPTFDCIGVRCASFETGCVIRYGSVKPPSGYAMSFVYAAVHWFSISLFDRRRLSAPCKPTATRWRRTRARYASGSPSSRGYSSRFDRAICFLVQSFLLFLLPADRVPETAVCGAAAPGADRPVRYASSARAVCILRTRLRLLSMCSLCGSRFHAKLASAS